MCDTGLFTIAEELDNNGRPTGKFYDATDPSVLHWLEEQQKKNNRIYTNHKREDNYRFRPNKEPPYYPLKSNNKYAVLGEGV